MPYDENGRGITHHLPVKTGGRPAKHGFKGLKNALKALGTHGLPANSIIAREVREWKEGVRQDRGGDLTIAQETILEGAAQQMLLRKCLWGYLADLLEKNQLIQDGMAPAILADYDRMDAALNRNLSRLGLDRLAKDSKVEVILDRIREHPSETVIEGESTEIQSIGTEIAD